MHGGKIFSKSGCFLSLLVLVLNLLSGILHSSAIREDIRSGTCRDLFKDNFEEPGEPEESVPDWSTRQDDRSCFICNPVNDKKSWFYTNFFKTGSAKLIHVNITMQFTNCSNCKNQNIKAFVLKEKLQDKSNPNLVYQKLNSLTVLKNIKVVEPDKRRTHYFQYHPDSKSVSSGDSLVFLGEGVCAIIYEIKVWTFYCMESTIKAVPLPETASPAVGSLRVNSSCPSNTVPQGSEVFGLCSSDGEWNDTGLTPCLCRKRFTLGKSGCEGCEKNTYKPDIGNSPCTPCPLNAESAPEEVRCECKYGFYRLVGDNDDNPCYGIPSAVENIKYVSKTSSSVRIQWSEPSRSGTKNSGVFYEVECFKCKRADSCEDTCGPETMYWPAKTNLTQLNVTVEKLSPSTLYKFIIYSKNIYNDRINESKWAYREKSVKTEGETKTSSLSLAVVIAVPVVVVILIVIIVILIVMLLKRRKIKRQFSRRRHSPSDFPLIGDKNYVDPTTYDDPERAVSEFAKELERDQLTFESVLGGGEFGDVYKGTLQRPGELPTKVAIKTLKPGSTAKSRKDFLLEASIMGQFKNLNVVSLEGVVTKSSPILIVTEFMENGSLDGYLKNNDGLLKPLQLLGMARGVASGMAYLAGMHFVHRDLAARNVLVNVNLACKVADFGLSRDIGESLDSEYETQGGRIAVRWTAPEAIRYRKFSTASDVWSYGILLWEIMSFAERPYWDWSNLEVLERVDGGYRLPPPMNCPKIVHELMMECWTTDRTKRPAFPDIVKVLDEWIRSPEKLKEDKIKIRKTEPLDFTTFNSVKEWLDAFKMGMYASSFTKAGYHDLNDVARMNEDELLNKVGVRLVGHRHKIYQRIKEMNEHMKLSREKSIRI